MAPRGPLVPARIKRSLFFACLLPVCLLAWLAVRDDLGANPVEAVTRGLGDWALNLLLATLAVTPLSRITGLAWLPGMRRTLGVSAFVYACLHVISYLWFDQYFAWSEIARDIVRRPFVSAGVAAFLLMLPLALTSNNDLVRRLGSRRWQSIHRVVYLVGPIAVIHYAWVVKRDLAGPIGYGVVTLLLLGSRLVRRIRPSASGR